MSKLDRDRLAAGERLLAEWKVEASVEALRGVLGRDAGADLAIMHRLGSIADPSAVVLLQEIEKTAASKDLRKEAKRALYRLEQRGVDVPKPVVVPVAPIRLGPELEGLVSPIDGRGDQLVWILKPRGEGVYHFFAVINDPEGMREAELNVVTRKGVRELRNELARKHQIEFVDADAAYCDFLMHRAFLWGRERGTHVHGDYAGMRAQIMRDPAPESLPPLILSVVDGAAIGADAEMVVRSKELLKEKEFRTWFLTRERLQPYLEAVNEIQSSPLVMDEVQKRERIEAVVQRAVRELYAGDEGRSFARRIFEMAHFFFASRRAEASRLAVAAALALEKSDAGGVGIGFCEQLVGSSLGFWYAVGKQEEEERKKESVLVTPQEFAAEQQRKG